MNPPYDPSVCVWPPLCVTPLKDTASPQAKLTRAGHACVTKAVVQGTGMGVGSGASASPMPKPPTPTTVVVPPGQVKAFAHCQGAPNGVTMWPHGLGVGMPAHGPSGLPSMGTSLGGKRKVLPGWGEEANGSHMAGRPHGHQRPNTQTHPGLCECISLRRGNHVRGRQRKRRERGGHRVDSRGGIGEKVQQRLAAGAPQAPEVPALEK